MILSKEKNNILDPINKYFPYEAYPQQIKLMNFLVNFQNF